MIKIKKKVYLIDNLIFIICFFPYLSFISTPFDTQPYALALSIIVLFVRFFFNIDFKIPNIIYYYFVIAIISFFNMLIMSSFRLGIRSFVGYISVPIFMLIAYTSFDRIKSNALIVITTVWFFFGVVQTFIYRDFGKVLVSRMSTSTDRGVTSLAVEPSYYAILCIFILVYNMILYNQNKYNKKVYNYIFFISSFQILLAKSAMGFVIYILFLFFNFLFSSTYKQKLKYISIFVLSYIIGLGYTIFIGFSSGRLLSLYKKLDEGLLNLILKDGSIADRLGHILVSFSSLSHSNGIGFGLGQWDNYAPYIAHNSGLLISNITNVNFTLGRIMSGWGSTIFEIGLFGVLFILGFIYLVCYNTFHLNSKNKSLLCITGFTIFITMMTSVPLTYPLFGYYMGTILNIRRLN